MQGSDGVVTGLDTVPLNNFAHILEVVEEFGYDHSEFLDRAGIARDLESLDSGDLPGETYYHFLSHLLGKIDIPAFGVRVGQKFSLIDYGVLGYACISSPTLRQSMQTFFRFQQIVGSNPSFSEALREEGEVASIEIQSSNSDERLARFDVEEAIGQWSIGAGELSSHDGTIYTRINLKFDEPGYAQDMQALLGCPVYYGQPRNEMLFPAQLLNQPIKMANELTTQLCKQQCDTILQGLTRQRGLVEQVRKLIINQPGCVPTPEDIATQLNISYRTLRRRLSNEGTSFKNIHHEVRMKMAAEYMRQTELTTQEIAFLLGYSEAPNFHRAFKLWYGMTPGDYRLSVVVEPQTPE
jgi:AraC-like DNA-binding protein